MVRCPVCRADNTAGPQCRRCRADLGLLFELEQQREQALAAAVQSVARGSWSEASRLAERASWLRRGPDAARLLAISRLLQRDFAGAWQVYRNGVRGT
jgi:hypothetical protein